MLSESEISLVQGDWAKAQPIAEQAATLFYDRLFALDPSLRSMFKSDFAEQKRKLLNMLSLAVAGLSDLSSLVPALRSLGERHVHYGVTPEHYDTVGAALLWTLGQGLGAGFDDVHAAAWAKTYGILAEVMKAAG